MKRNYPNVLGLIIGVIAYFSLGGTLLRADRSFPESYIKKLNNNPTYGKLPLCFEPNLGQADQNVKFLSRGGSFSFFLMKEGMLLAFPFTKSENRNLKILSRKNITSDFSRIQIQWVALSLSGVSDEVNFYGENPKSGISNYLIGPDRSKWVTRVPLYGQVRVENVYPGIDIVYYGNPSQLEYDFRLKPGATPDSIRFRCRGIDRAEYDSQGNVKLKIGSHSLIFKQPVVYQENEGAKIPVIGKYKVFKNGDLGFEIEEYDRTKLLVIDPVLDYSTFIGGLAGGIAVDASGNAYLTGSTIGNTLPPPPFPSTAGAYQTALSGSFDGFITKLNPTGTAVLYSTLLGGSATASGVGCSAIVVDATGDAYVTGQQLSNSFPTTPGAFQTLAPNFSGSCFISELDPTGSNLLYSTYLGGNVFEKAYGMALQRTGNVYVTGFTSSTNFPTSAGAFQTSLGIGAFCNLFVTKLFPGGNGSADLVYSTYLGGNSAETGYGIAFDNAGDAYVVGSTTSPNYPTTPGAYQTIFGGGPTGGNQTVILSKLNSSGTNLLYSTFVGPSNSSIASAVAVDAMGNAYFTGEAENNFPTTPGCYYPTFPGVYDTFVAKLKPGGNGNADLIYSTYLNSTATGGSGIVVDGYGNAYITGAWDYMMGTVFTTTPGAFQTTYQGGSYDAYLVILDPAGSNLLYSTLLGSSGEDIATGIGLDPNGGIFITGTAGASNFPHHIRCLPDANATWFFLICHQIRSLGLRAANLYPHSHDLPHSNPFTNPNTHIDLHLYSNGHFIPYADLD